MKKTKERDMIKDVLGWHLDPHKTVILIGKIVEVTAPVPVPPPYVPERRTHHKAAPKAAPAKLTGVNSRAALWARCKKANPRRAAKLHYTSTTNAQMKAFLAKA